MKRRTAALRERAEIEADNDNRRYKLEKEQKHSKAAQEAFKRKPYQLGTVEPEYFPELDD